MDKLWNPIKKRVLLKISGEAFSGKSGFGYESNAVDYLINEIVAVAGLCELGIVVGGGNLFRGSIQGKTLGLDSNEEKAEAHYVGMLMTIANGKILGAKLKHRGIENRHQSGIEAKKIAEPFIQLRATRHLEKGRVVIFSGGTGNPFSTTDSAMMLRALEIGAAVVLKGTKVDGIYEEDPEKNPDARFIERISPDDYLRRNLRILDAGAVSQARDERVPIHVFNFFVPGNLKRVIQGEKIGSVIF